MSRITTSPRLISIRRGWFVPTEAFDYPVARLALRPKDERLEPEKSAEAAAKYLKYLYGRFQDWPLVMAAYNAGESHVRSLLDRHQAKTFDQISTRLPAETQMYIPRIDATLQRREGVTLSQLQAPHA